jgi:HSP20 family protein
VTVEGNLLTIAGKRASDRSGNEEAHFHARERFAGAFRRIVTLPDGVDAAKVDASYANGVLRILLPKLEQVRPRRIEVKELEYKG